MANKLAKVTLAALVSLLGSGSLSAKGESPPSAARVQLTPGYDRFSKFPFSVNLDGVYTNDFSIGGNYEPGTRLSLESSLPAFNIVGPFGGSLDCKIESDMKRNLTRAGGGIFGDVKGVYVGGGIDFENTHSDYNVKDDKHMNALYAAVVTGAVDGSWYTKFGYDILSIKKGSFEGAAVIPVATDVCFIPSAGSYFTFGKKKIYSDSGVSFGLRSTLIGRNGADGYGRTDVFSIESSVGVSFIKDRTDELRLYNSVAFNIRPFERFPFTISPLLKHEFTIAPYLSLFDFINGFQAGVRLSFNFGGQNSARDSPTRCKSRHYMAREW
jgi:hypothetical protein